MARVLTLLKDLIGIESVNPSLPGGAGGEKQIVDWVQSRLEEAGISWQRQAVLPDRENIIATIPGRDPTRSVLFESHLDTASVVDMSIPPFEAVEGEGRVYGRGSCDTKGSAAAMMEALLRTVEAGEEPAHTIHWAGVVDEEFAMLGSRQLVQWIEERRSRHNETIEGLIIGEPTELEVVTAHKGTIHFEVELRGRSAHGSRPELGRNAVIAAARVVEELTCEYQELISTRTHELTGPATLNIGKIEGGSQANIVPSLCRITLDRRTVPGEENTAALAEIETFLHSLTAKMDEIELQVLEPKNSCLPVETDSGSPFVSRMLLARGEKKSPVGVAYATDGSQLRACGIPMVVFGPGSIAQAHTQEEFIDIAQLLKAADVYQALIQNGVTEHG